jgi:hypothetical protein
MEGRKEGRREERKKGNEKWDSEDRRGEGGGKGVKPE